MFYNLKNGLIAVLFVGGVFKLYDIAGNFVGWANFKEVVDLR